MHNGAHILALLMKLQRYVHFIAPLIAYLCYALFWETG